jgi:hypothetical protein
MIAVCPDLWSQGESAQPAATLFTQAGRHHLLSAVLLVLGWCCCYWTFKLDISCGFISSCCMVLEGRQNRQSEQNCCCWGDAVVACWVLTRLHACLRPQKTAVAIAYAKPGKGLLKLNGENRDQWTGSGHSSSGCVCSNPVPEVAAG